MHHHSNGILTATSVADEFAFYVTE